MAAVPSRSPYEHRRGLPTQLPISSLAQNNAPVVPGQKTQSSTKSVTHFETIPQLLLIFVPISVGLHFYGP